MEKMIAFCGITCTDCDALIATQENNDAKRRKIAADWSKDFGHEIKPEEINCDGCLNTEGRHINYCGICEIRKCGMEKEVENCAHCIEYKCEKLEKFHEQAPNAKKTIEEIREKLMKKTPKKKSK
jgi:hypothetical protein